MVDNKTVSIPIRNITAVTQKNQYIYCFYLFSNLFLALSVRCFCFGIEKNVDSSSLGCTFLRFLVKCDFMMDLCAIREKLFTGSRIQLLFKDPSWEGSCTRECFAF